MAREDKKTLCIDIGGTKTKLAVCDADATPAGSQLAFDTPETCDPDPILALITSTATELGDFDRTSVGFPGVVKEGIVKTAANLSDAWIDYPLADVMTKRLGKPARVANDADVQGLGAISGQGVELVLTLGTGIGSSLFLDGRLIPNLELGHLPFRGDRSFEEDLGNTELGRIGAGAWRDRLRDVLSIFEACFCYDRLYLGGGNARHLVGQLLPANVTCVRNDAGLTGGVALWTGIPEDRRVPVLDPNAT